MIEADVKLAERALAAQRAGRTAEAEALWRHLLAVDAANVAASFHLGMLLASQDRLEDAAERFSHVLGLLPSSAEASGNLGFVYQRLGRLEEAVELYRRALAAQPDLPILRNNLAGALHDLGRAEEAFETYRTLADSADPRLAANFLTSLNLVPGTPADFQAAARAWASRFAEPLTPARAGVADDPERRLRIGYVGAEGMRRHTLAMTWLPLIEAHDRAVVDPVIYSDVQPEREDDVSCRFQAAATWCRTRPLDDAALAERIRADRIDILVDGIGFAAGTRLLAFARRPAPVQIHFPPMSTTGMSAIDYIIGDEQLIPPSAASFFGERIWRLPCGFLYSPLTLLPHPAAATRSPDRPVTFASFNRLAKIGADLVDIWARILKAVPGARFLFKTGGPLTPSMPARTRELFAAAGIAPARLDLRGRTTDDEHFRHFLDVDIMLDTFPHGGVLTTCDALAMGVPVITLAGERLLERYGAAILSAAGFAEGITRNPDEYVECAVRLAARRDQLRAQRGALGQRMRMSALCDATAFARGMENAYRMMWRERCGFADQGRA